MIEYKKFLLSKEGMAVVWIATILVFLVFLIILVKRLSDSIRSADRNNGTINQYLALVPADRIATVNAIYQNTRKNTGIAMLLCLAGGTFGLQRAYLGKRRSALMMFFFFWTGIPTVISLFDLTAMPGTVSSFNLTMMKSLYDQIAIPEYERK